MFTLKLNVDRSMIEMGWVSGRDKSRAETSRCKTFCCSCSKLNLMDWFCCQALDRKSIL